MLKKIQGFVKTILKQEYAKASIYYVLANIIGQGVVLFSSAIFTRMMSKADYGFVSTYSTWVLVLNTFICLNLFITLRNAYVDYSYDYDRYASSIILLNIFLGIIFTILIVGISYLFSLKFGIAEVLLACLQSVALNIINCMLAIQSMKNEYKQRAFMMVAPNWAHIILSVVLMLIVTQNLYFSKILGNSFGLVFFGAFCCISIFKRAAPKIILEYWKYALKISLPSIFHTLGDLILIQCDRLMLTAMVGAEETAEYSVIYTVCSIIVAIYIAIGGAWTPWFFKKASKGEKEETRKYSGYYLLFFSLFTCAMMTVSPEIIKIISPRDYWSGIRYVSPLVISSYLIFLLSFFAGYLLFKKETGKIARNTIIAAILNLVLNFFLIPQYKSLGAVTATVVSYTILLLLHYLSVGKEGRTYFHVRSMCLNLLTIVVYGIVFFFVIDLWIVRYMLFIVITILVFFAKGRQAIGEFIGGRK